MDWRVIHGDALDVLRGTETASVDAVVTDPPYGLASKPPDAAEILRHWLNGDDYEATGGGFMGKAWDAVVPGPCVWREVLRVLKPGGHLLAFGGTRTVDLLTVALRLAGFEIRDDIVHIGGRLQWIYGSGFPKSHNVGKAIDRAARRNYVAAALRLGLEIPGNSRHDWTKAEHSPSDRWWERFKAVLSPDQWLAVEREVVGHNGRGPGWFTTGDGHDITAPATPEAAAWEGWGTALKPAHEPIILARAPLAESTIAANVLAHGTGALNIDGCRVPTGGDYVPRPSGMDRYNAALADQGYRPDAYEQGEPPLPAPSGRWPPNLALSHAPECDPGFLYCAKASRRERNNGLDGLPERARYKKGGAGGTGGKRSVAVAVNAPPARNHHPTVKPIQLMRWLCRLISPPGGLVCDPFAGSGSTGCAAVLEGFRFVGIDSDADYCEIARRRIAWWQDAPARDRAKTEPNAGGGQADYSAQQTASESPVYGRFNGRAAKPDAQLPLPGVE